MSTVQDPTHPTGVAVTGDGHEAEAKTARERKQDDTIAMRLMGYGWDEIARVLGYPSPRHALTAFELALQRNLSEDDASTAKMRDLAGRRLERLLRAVWTTALNPNHPNQMAAQDRARSVIADQAKLFGLNAPQEMVVSTPSATELQNFVSRAVAAANSGLEEDDIFDADVVEQGEIGA
jgi:hypothetical protein